MTISRILLALILVFILAQQVQASSELIDIIDNVLLELDPTIPYSQTAKELLLLTVAVESDCGTANLKKSNGSIGWFQILPSTMKETYQWACDQKMLKWKLDQLKETSEVHFHAAIARIYYYRMAKLPTVYWIKGGRGKMTEASIPAIATCWKNIYNTELGKGTVEGAIVKYKRFYWGRKY